MSEEESMDHEDNRSNCRLPEHCIFFEIFPRLPIKSLFRFKCVSKTWCDLINSEAFRNCWGFVKTSRSMTGFFYRSSLHYNEKIRFVLTNKEEDSITDPSSSLGFLDESAVLVGSCNGLLCWCSGQVLYYVCNPLTKKSVMIKSSIIKQSKIFATGIAADPSMSPYFKLVVLFCRKSTLNRLKLWIFCSRIGRWQESRDFLRVDEHLNPSHHRRSVLFNGVLYWLIAHIGIVAYDLWNESLQSKELPVGIDDTSVGCLGESNGCLHYSRFIGVEFNVWLIKTDTSFRNAEWIHVCTVDFEEIMYQNQALVIPRGHLVQIETLSFLPDCKGLFLSIGRSKIVIYDYYGNEFVEVCKLIRDDEGPLHADMFFPFVHTLAMPEIAIADIP